MERIYIEYDNARITLQPNTYLLDIELYSGVQLTGVEARRLFPVTGSDKYITLLDDAGVEVAVIRDLNTLMPDSRQAVYTALDHYYLIPHITKITDIEEKYGTIRVHAETDRGSCYFEVGDRSHNLKILYDGRVLVRDTNDNRYEIPNMKILDKKSLDVLLL